MAETFLTPAQAQAVVDDRIEDFGLDALPKVYVTAQPDGTWRVQWSGRTAICGPMTMDQWKEWLERHVGPTSPSLLATTEG